MSLSRRNLLKYFGLGAAAAVTPKALPSYGHNVGAEVSSEDYLSLKVILTSQTDKIQINDSLGRKCWCVQQLLYLPSGYKDLQPGVVLKVFVTDRDEESSEFFEFRLNKDNQITDQDGKVFHHFKLLAIQSDPINPTMMLITGPASVTCAGPWWGSSQIAKVDEKSVRRAKDKDVDNMVLDELDFEISAGLDKVEPEKYHYKAIVATSDKPNRNGDVFTFADPENMQTQPGVELQKNGNSYVLSAKCNMLDGMPEGLAYQTAVGLLEMQEVDREYWLESCKRNSPKSYEAVMAQFKVIGDEGT